MVQQQVQDGKFENINNVYDHLNTDSAMRVHKQAQKL